MKLYTSYFAHLKKIDKTIVPIAIVAIKPSWADIVCYQKLAPSLTTLYNYKRDGDERAYTEAFEQQLQALNVHDVVAELSKMSQGNGIALICYEAPGKFCHRHLVAKWLTDNGYECTEL